MLDAMLGLPRQKRRRRWRAVAFWTVATVVGLGLVYWGVFWFLRNPAPLDEPGAAEQRADAARLEADVRFLAQIEPARSIGNRAALDRAADYIGQGFAAAGCTVREQVYRARDDRFRNIICSFGPDRAERIVIGAHYDVHGDDNPGADDNASGVAGILELARLLGAQASDLRHRIDLVAFSLEEWPAYETDAMGSAVYADSLIEEGAVLKLMISVEMIGYFSDAPGSQHYPLSFLNWFYPERGDFIGVIGLAFDRALVKRVRELMRFEGGLPVYSINAPAFVPGIDRSDHRNFWQRGLPAVMVTDTGDYRNPHYHSAADTPETLDVHRMAEVVDGLYRVAVEY
jgi:hypothetical protein